MISCRPRPPPFAGVQIIPPTNGGEAIRHDYVILSGKQELRLEGYLQGFAGLGYQYRHGCLPNGRTPADDILEFEITPALRDVERPVRKGTMWLKLVNHSGSVPESRKIWTGEEDSIHKLKHRAWKYGGADEPHHTLLFREIGASGEIEELEGKLDDSQSPNAAKQARCSYLV